MTQPKVIVPEPKPAATTTQASGVTTEKAANGTEGLPINKEQEESMGHVAVIVIAVVLVIGIVVIVVSVNRWSLLCSTALYAWNGDSPHSCPKSCCSQKLRCFLFFLIAFHVVRCKTRLLVFVCVCVLFFSKQ